MRLTARGRRPEGYPFGYPTGPATDDKDSVPAVVAMAVRKEYGRLWGRRRSFVAQDRTDDVYL